MTFIKFQRNISTKNTKKHFWGSDLVQTVFECHTEIDEAVGCMGKESKYCFMDFIA